MLIFRFCFTEIFTLYYGGFLWIATLSFCLARNDKPAQSIARTIGRSNLAKWIATTS
ncbi:hypothetical protein [Helicobacter fennelliae]|uniref:Uncharacterized protein n=1 Tax=Helicobacter fennelliae MRY12-0050 TaxID=1325130 RepID=T1CNF8_9HELI|nr:hypothetical protein [Helicobacter fennelliae]GAD18319.1 hypothetical protein HFN_1917 [Helicobacter fennelliae MRY12-0050]